MLSKPHFSLVLRLSRTGGPNQRADGCFHILLRCCAARRYHIIRDESTQSLACYCSLTPVCRISPLVMTCPVLPGMLLSIHILSQGRAVLAIMCGTILVHSPKTTFFDKYTSHFPSLATPRNVTRPRLTVPGTLLRALACSYTPFHHHRAHGLTPYVDNAAQPVAWY